MHEPVAVATEVAPPLKVDPQSDADLVSRVLRGEMRAYEELVTRYERPARAACFGILKDWHAAQDAAQDAFISAHANLKSLRNASTFGQWLLTIAHNRARRVARTRRRDRSLHGIPEPSNSDPRANSGGDLLEMVACLPEHERAVVMLRYVDGHDLASISRICGRPVGTVSKQLSRAHQRLYKLLTKGNGP